MAGKEGQAFQFTGERGQRKGKEKNLYLFKGLRENNLEESRVYRRLLGQIKSLQNTNARFTVCHDEEEFDFSI